MSHRLDYVTRGGWSSDPCGGGWNKYGNVGHPAQYQGVDNSPSCGIQSATHKRTLNTATHSIHIHPWGPGGIECWQLYGCPARGLVRTSVHGSGGPIRWCHFWPLDMHIRVSTYLQHIWLLKLPWPASIPMKHFKDAISATRRWARGNLTNSWRRYTMSTGPRSLTLTSTSVRIDRRLPTGHRSMKMTYYTAQSKIVVTRPQRLGPSAAMLLSATRMI